MSHEDFGTLVPLGWNDRVAALLSDGLDRAQTPARVVRTERSTAVAVTPDGGETLVRHYPLPVVGDWITVVGDAVALTATRWSELARQDPDGTSVQVLAANLDVVLIAAPADRLSPARIERELSVAWESGARPVVVLTKSDLGGDDAVELAERLIGVDIIATSALDGRGVDELRERLRPSLTAGLLGPSGAGKSSLANALVGREVLATGAVREGDHRGRHTTTSRQLVPVPGGGVLIDTPGLRSLGLTGGTDVGQAFPEIDGLAGECRFTDCRHEVEPGCAVTAAVEAGQVDPARLRNFRKLQREASREATRHDPLLRRAARAEMAKRGREGRENMNRKRR